MAVVTVEEVNQWLEESRGKIVDLVDDIAELEATAMELVFSALRSRYSVTLWTNPNTTPKLVRSIVAMLVAAWQYKRVFADQPQAQDRQSYGDWLESRAMVLLGSLASGSSQLTSEEPETGGRPDFWPTDVATQIAEEEGADALGAAERMFSVGQVL